MTVAALYVDPKGVYANLLGVEVWDEARDARTYAGPWPVIAHPPCARWCQLAPLVELRYGYKRGEDGGCFAAALSAVRRFGGVLEHPAYTAAWRRFDLPIPTPGLWTAALGDDGWVAHFEQHAYGVTARKATWLYAVGCELPELRWGINDPKPAGGWWVTGQRKHAATGRLRGKGASATPEPLRDTLLAMARSAHPNGVRALSPCSAL